MAVEGGAAPLKSRNAFAVDAPGCAVMSQTPLVSATGSGVVGGLVAFGGASPGGGVFARATRGVVIGAAAVDVVGNVWSSHL